MCDGNFSEIARIYMEDGKNDTMYGGEQMKACSGRKMIVPFSSSTFPLVVMSVATVRASGDRHKKSISDSTTAPHGITTTMVRKSTFRDG